MKDAQRETPTASNVADACAESSCTFPKALGGFVIVGFAELQPPSNIGCRGRKFLSGLHQKNG